MHETLNLEDYMHDQWQHWHDLHQRADLFRSKVESILREAGQTELVLQLGFLVETIHAHEKEAREDYAAF